MSKKYNDRILTPSGVSSKKVKSSFGMKILQKFGWTEGTGLGAEGNKGIAECIQVKRREDNLAVGAEEMASQKTEKQWDNWWAGVYNDVAKKLNTKHTKKVIPIRFLLMLLLFLFFWQST
jgi:hypothetical protein